jgi:predicted metal-dependent peptidase
MSNPKSTSHDLNSAIKADDPELESLSPHIVKLYFDEPFWSHVLRIVDIRKDYTCPTAGVMTAASGPCMVWNPKWMGSLSNNQVKGLLKHEAMHLVLSHTTSRRYEPHIIHNWAADLAINSDIPVKELPEDGLIPGRPFRKLTLEESVRMSPKQLERHLKLSAFIAALPKGESTEWYFAKLMENPEISESIQQSEMMFDVHDGWNDLSEEEREIAKAKIAQAVEQAVKEADRTGNWGSVPAEMRAQIRASLVKTLDWKSILKRFCGQSRVTDRRSSWTKLNKRYPGAAPGRKKNLSATIAVYIDQSGSINNEDLERVFSELGSLSKEISFVTYHFDTEVDDNSRTEWKARRPTNSFRTRTGGTNFSAPIKHSNDRKREFDGIIIITDGEAPKPVNSLLKCCWVLVPGTKLPFKPQQGHFAVTMDRISLAKGAA